MAAKRNTVSNQTRQDQPTFNVNAKKLYTTNTGQQTTGVGPRPPSTRNDK